VPIRRLGHDAMAVFVIRYLLRLSLLIEVLSHFVIATKLSHQAHLRGAEDAKALLIADPEEAAEDGAEDVEDDKEEKELEEDEGAAKDGSEEEAAEKDEKDDEGEEAKPAEEEPKEEGEKPPAVETADAEHPHRSPGAVTMSGYDEVAARVAAEMTEGDNIGEGTFNTKYKEGAALAGSSGGSSEKDAAADSKKGKDGAAEEANATSDTEAGSNESGNSTEAEASEEGEAEEGSAEGEESEEEAAKMENEEEKAEEEADKAENEEEGQEGAAEEGEEKGEKEEGGEKAEEEEEADATEQPVVGATEKQPVAGAEYDSVEARVNNEMWETDRVGEERERPNSRYDKVAWEVARQMHQTDHVGEGSRYDTTARDVERQMYQGDHVGEHQLSPPLEPDFRHDYPRDENGYGNHKYQRHNRYVSREMHATDNVGARTSGENAFDNSVDANYAEDGPRSKYDHHGDQVRDEMDETDNVGWRSMQEKRVYTTPCPKPKRDPGYWHAHNKNIAGAPHHSPKDDQPPEDIDDMLEDMDDK